MARINVEDSIYGDLRFMKLMQKHGHFAAIGMVVLGWRLAQKNFLNNEGIIPQSDWDESGLEDLIWCRLAEQREGGVYIKGSDENFAWLKQKQVAGQKSGASRIAKARERALNGNEHPLDSVERERTAANGGEPLTLTLTHSLNQNTNTLSVSTDPKPPVFKKTAKLDCFLFKLWNEQCGTLAKARGISPKRWTAAMTRFKEFPDEKYWAEVLEKITKSDFCCGVNDRQWKADFDFFVRPDTHLKVMEGKYDNKESARKPVEYTKDWGLGQ